MFRVITLYGADNGIDGQKVLEVPHQESTARSSRT